ncbi:MAG TPA: alcohol dehydrogenase catalytic domain-containing protein [Candidatus Sumerlaeota bacterium]|nr:alcohol dehydrogenase catalytic domain-containing protein [Candidatus Sumerlaeota bacterium]
MTASRASYLMEPRRIEFQDEARPAPGPGEVLIELTAVGVCGSDVHWYLDGRIGTTRLEGPLTLGHEPAGRVVEVGAGADPALKGKRVAIEPAIACGHCPFCQDGDTNLCPHVRFMGTPPTQGAFRQWTTHPAHLVAELPATVSDEVGALLEPLAIAIHATDLLKPRAGATWAIVGAGPIGLCALEAVKLTGPGCVMIVEPLEYRRALARSMGADVVLAPEQDDLAAAVARATGGYGADYVIEAAGKPASFELMTQVARPGAKIAVVGIDPHDRFGFNNSVGRRKGLTLYMVRRSRRTLERAIAITAAGRWRPDPIITHRRPFGDLARSLERVAGFEDGVIKTIIDPRR